MKIQIETSITSCDVLGELLREIFFAQKFNDRGRRMLGGYEIFDLATTAYDHGNVKIGDILWVVCYKCFNDNGERIYMAYSMDGDGMIIFILSDEVLVNDYCKRRDCWRWSNKESCKDLIEGIKQWQ